MKKGIRQSVMILIIAALIFVPFGSAALAQEYAGVAERSAGSMIADILVLRPLGLAAIVLGSAVFVVSLPFAATSGDIATPAEKLVEEPVQFTFTRPLGTF